MKMVQVYGEHGITCVRKLSNGYDMEAMHIHDVYEIYLAMSDGLKFFVNNHVYSLDCGDLMLFTNNDLHKISVPPDRPYERYVITFAPGMLPSGGEAYAGLLDCFGSRDGLRSHKLTLTAGEQEEFMSLAEAIGAEAEGGSYGRLGQYLALCRLLLFINRVRERAPQEIPPVRRSLHPQIRLVIDHIDGNFHQPITLDELSAMCYLNKHYLCRLFRRDTGFRIHDYIAYRRLAQAISLLRAGESVSGAARLSGFGSDTFFITTFKKNIGMTPYKYAQSQRARER